MEPLVSLKPVTRTDFLNPLYSKNAVSPIFRGVVEYQGLTCQLSARSIGRSGGAHGKKNQEDNKKSEKKNQITHVLGYANRAI